MQNTKTSQTGERTLPITKSRYALKGDGSDFYMYQARYENEGERTEGGGEWAMTPEQAYDRCDKSRVKRIAEVREFNDWN